MKIEMKIAYKISTKVKFHQSDFVSDFKFRISCVEMNETFPLYKKPLWGLKSKTRHDLWIFAKTSWHFKTNFVKWKTL